MKEKNIQKNVIAIVDTSFSNSYTKRKPGKRIKMNVIHAKKYKIQEWITFNTIIYKWIAVSPKTLIYRIQYFSVSYLCIIKIKHLRFCSTVTSFLCEFDTVSHICPTKTLAGLTGVDESVTAEALEKGLSKNIKNTKNNDKNKSSAGRTA